MRMRYQPFHFLSSIFYLLAMSCCTPSSSEEKIDRPLNIVLIMADDLGYETIAANGGTSYQTPAIDQLAANGLRFNHCYAQPLCTPSRVQIMTGIYNVRNYVRFGLLEKSQITFGHLFQDAGYATCVIGKWQLGKAPNSPQLAGFDQHCLWQVREGRMDSTGRDTRFSQPVLEVDGQLKTYAKSDYGPDVVSNYGLDFIEKSHEQGKPFLLYYPMILTHCPFSPTPDSPDWMKNDTAVMRYKGEPRYFADMVAYTDKIVGKINQKLEELGIQENTLLIFTGDNGTDRPIVSMLKGREVAGAKNQSTDAGTRVPLMVQWPGVVEPGSVTNQLIDFSDFLPTICEAASVPFSDSPDLDGKSFVPLLRGDSSLHRQWIYSWYSRSGEAEKARVFVRNQRYKLYESGEFYEVPQDYTEQNPLEVQALGSEAQETHQMLQRVLDRYKSQRLNRVPSSGQ
ncbi:MAG TPA: sulfatase-like hydrolase/transferase [Saprospiraceae bacterium]|nr:sulfatase-like hydrolase/transferase [Saprospiraceae bacterium]